uniref:Uncharacterized protein n=1 Tax=Triticum urartu TaxID=4572 RepID=A0A8R7UGN6_TRIUA
MSPHRHRNPVSPTRFRQLEHRFTDVLAGFASVAGARSTASSTSTGAGLGLSTTGVDTDTPGREEEEEEEEEDGDVESGPAKKQFWQRLCVAGLPGKPQLLAQSVISGARSSVGSSFL